MTTTSDVKGEHRNHHKIHLIFMVIKIDTISITVL